MRWIQPNKHNVRRAQPRARALLGAAALLISAACSAPERVAAPVVVVPALDRSERDSRVSNIEQFALAQGTWCDNSTYLDCSGIKDYDIGWILGNSGAFVPAPAGGDYPFYIFDLGGVNARWWARHHISPRLPAYEIAGSVDESRLPDGRRRLRINARAQNTFTWFDLDHYDGTGQYVFTDRLFGADFFQYPSVDPTVPDVTPVLANVNADLDLVLPANFVGYPDLIQMIDFPLPGMEVRKLNVTVQSDGRLLHQVNGIPAGAFVRVSVSDDWSGFLTGAGAYRAPRFSFTRIGGDGRSDEFHGESGHSVRLTERERHRRSGH